MATPRLVVPKEQREHERFSNLDLERIALYNALTVAGGFAELERWLDVDDFTMRRHQVLFQVAAAMQKTGIAPTLHSVLASLMESGGLTDIGGISAVTDMGDGIPRVSSGEALAPYCRSIRTVSIRRRGYLEADRLRAAVESGEVSPDEFAEASKRLRDLQSTLEDSSAGLSIADAIESCGGMAAILSPPQIVVPVPWMWLRKLLPGGGFQPGQLWTLAGRPGTGKSAAAVQLAAYAAQRGCRVGVFSLEMPRMEILQRLMAMLCQVPLVKIQSGTTSAEDQRAIYAAMNDLDRRHFEIFDDVHTLNGILRRIADRKKRKAGYDLVVVDYIGQVSPPKRAENRTNEVAQVTRGLKLAAMEHRVTVLALSQMNRGIEQDKSPNREPEMRDLRESGSIEQDSDGVMFLHPDRKDKSLIRLLVKKQRNGPVGHQDLRFFKAMVWFGEAARSGEYDDNGSDD
jgi:replicative DNA helicase